MAFGNESKPSRIWSFGASEPTEGLEEVLRQLREGHEYHCRLVRAELDRRAAVDRALAEIAPRLLEVETELAQVEADLEAARTQVKAANSAARKKRRGQEDSEQARTLAQRRKALWAERKTLRKATFASAAWEKAEEAVEEVHARTRKNLYAHARAAGLAWGTCVQLGQIADRARRGAPPRFPRRDQDQRVVVQLQKGLSVEDATSGTDQRLRIEARPEGVRAAGTRTGRMVTIETVDQRPDHERLLSPPPGWGRKIGDPQERARAWQARPERERLASRTFVDHRCVDDGSGQVLERRLGDAVVRLRIGSEGEEGRRPRPVWCTVPVVLHRPLPQDASIKWAWLIRRRVGTQWRWSVQLVLSRESWSREDAAREGVVGIDVGWRVMDDDGRLRVACWSGSDGREGELSLPAGWLGQMRKTEDIRSIRDRLFDQAREALVQWTHGRDLPDWFREAISARTARPGARPGQTLGQWRSPARLAALTLRWRDARWDGDQEGFELAEAWRHRDKHLYEYEAHLRDQLQASRADAYRCFAASMRRSYATAVVEGEARAGVDVGPMMDLRKFHEIPPPEEAAGKPGDKGDWAKTYVRDACLSSLRQFLKESLDVVTRPAPGTTSTCHACGQQEEWDRRQVFHVCGQCRARWDQDYNAARNLLQSWTASGQVVQQS